MKQCINCKELKEFTFFFKNKSRKDGYGKYCKDCFKLKSKKYRFSKKGLISKIYNKQIKSCKRRGHDLPKYSRIELFNYFKEDKIFNLLYRNWIKSGYNTDLIPSIDRLNDYETYSFDNIQVITWKENNRKGNLDIINGKNNKLSKEVYQYKNGLFVNRFYSLADAERKTGFSKASIFLCANKKQKEHKGYQWSYKKIY